MAGLRRISSQLWICDSSHEFRVALTLHGCAGRIGEQRDEEEVNEVDEGEPVVPEEACYREMGQTQNQTYG